MSSAYSKLTFEQKRAIYLAQQEGYAFLERERALRLRNLEDEAQSMATLSVLFAHYFPPTLDKATGLMDWQKLASAWNSTTR